MEYAVDLEKEPTLEEDMATFPKSTEKEVKLARKLWTSGMVQIYFEWTNKPTSTKYVSRIAIRENSVFFATAFPQPRSWPFLCWSKVEKRTHFKHHLTTWDALNTYLEYIYTMRLEVDGESTLTTEHLAALGEFLQDAKFYNICMTYCFEGIGSRLSQREEIFFLDQILGSSVKCIQTVRDAYCGQKFVQYLVEKIVWDTCHSRPYQLPKDVNQYLQAYINHRNNLAVTNPPPAAPYHQINRHNYMMSEKKEIFRVTAVKEDPADPSSGVKREATPDGDNHDKKRVRTVGPGNQVKVADKREEVVEEAGARDEPRIMEKMVLGSKVQKQAGVKEEPSNVFEAEDRPLNGGKMHGQQQETIKETKPEAKPLKKEIADRDTEAEIQVLRVRRVKTVSRKDVYDLT